MEKTKQLVGLLAVFSSEIMFEWHIWTSAGSDTMKISKWQQNDLVHSFSPSNRKTTPGRIGNALRLDASLCTNQSMSRRHSPRWWQEIHTSSVRSLNGNMTPKLTRSWALVQTLVQTFRCENALSLKQWCLILNNSCSYYCDRRHHWWFQRILCFLYSYKQWSCF